uniref:Uncharacterized protein n=1 Tax=Hucho hucho TaxID=62062 RepID=A0A4W5LBC7_9TELE
MELNSVLLTAGGSIGFFKLVNCGVRKLPIPVSACRNAWKWRNICTSFTHSLMTGIWAVLCFFVHPQMAEDLIGTHSVFSHALVSVSIGECVWMGRGKGKGYVSCPHIVLRSWFRMKRNQAQEVFSRVRNTLLVTSPNNNTGDN